MKSITDMTHEVVDLVSTKFPEWKGEWHDVPKMMMYIVTECAEAMEAWRDDNHEEFAEELADIYIRLLDYAAKTDVDLEAEYEKKMAKNWGRPLHHGRINI